MVTGDAVEGMSGLHAAVHFNLTYWANHLIESRGSIRETNPNKFDNLRETPLHKALIKPIVNDVDIVKALVRYGAKLDLKGPRGYSAMTSAIRYGPSSIAKVLVVSQTDLDVEIFEGWTSFWQAFHHGREIIGKSKIGPSKAKGSQSLRQAVESHAQYLTDLLLERGVDMNNLSRDGWIPLKHAIRYMHNDPSKIERLLKRYPNPSNPRIAAGAISNNRPAIVKLLIEHGADKDKAYENGSTSLIDAINKNHMGIVWVLVDQGASINETDINGHAALTRAVLENEKSISWLLTAKGASIFCPIEDLPNLFCWSLAYNDLSLAWFLCQRQKVADIPNDQGMTPLHWPVRDSHLDAVRFLVQQDVRLKLKDSKGNTPLILATLGREIAIMKPLLGYGALADGRDNQGLSALPHASRLDFHEGVQVLLRWSSDRNLVDSKGFNALHHAVVSDNGDDALILLTTACVRLERYEEHGRKPLMLCAQLDRLYRAKQFLLDGTKSGAPCPRGWNALKHAEHYGSENVQGHLEFLDRDI
ncbi:ankyrin repeat-containing domain protein [Colletotrichum godetiae]|uniref:Ankyrin repeat-containing domain protein n=1 Tax=Colletotrichum godetiae TaxID=1209918 RepID=A0AAJ0AN01_9PEZI|nr:ankyrin repeat-containing domain protein [Colletotrichum godetiae]KAK1676864.1 ankyrin repeat-containing domain protein [Colletotrichum godetiae]